MSLDSLLWTAVGGNKSGNDGAAAEDELKFLFVGGKGGVGKSTTSSAIANLLATKCAKRVLLVSTDPAHSLSDVFRSSDDDGKDSYQPTFGNVPKSVDLTASKGDIANLHVMEINPSDTMKVELAKWAKLADDVAGNDASSPELASKIHSFQEWLSGVPGIDEATALASAVRYIESGDYDIIVFDTAPTGHTLKLLQMPDILQAGIERLQSWQGTLWGYWEAFKGFTGGVAASAAAKRKSQAKEEISAMLEEYKRGIRKVAQMLQDQRRTRFVVICIAEYLSVSETRRLLQQLKKNMVNASHIIVNQLVIQDALSNAELKELEGLAEVGSLHLNRTLLGKTVHACRLTTSRKQIQEKYLGQLKSFPETQHLLDGICKVPLLPEEVTGVDALIRFGELLVRNPPNMSEVKSSSSAASSTKKRPLYEEDTSSGSTWSPSVGDAVTVTGLTKSEQYNGLQGVVISALDTETGRIGIEVNYNGAQKQLALQKKNLCLVPRSKKRKVTKPKESTSTGNQDTNASGGVAVAENVGKAKKLLEDPEIKAMVQGNPRFAAAVEDVMANPMNFMKYLMDPEMSPLISKAMSKLQG